MSYQSAAGAILSISLVKPATHDAAGWAALTMKPIGEITNIGEFGKEFALITHNRLSTRGVEKLKGSFNNGQLSPSLAFDKDDPGQIDMAAALDSDDPAYFTVTLQDGTLFHMVGLVMSFKVGVPDTDGIVTAPTTIELQSDEILRP